MCKFGFNFSQLYLSLPRIRGKWKIYRGGSNQNSPRQSEFYCFKFKLTHKHQCYLRFYCIKCYSKSCLEHKSQANATLKSFG